MYTYLKYICLRIQYFILLLFSIVIFCGFFNSKSQDTTIIIGYGSGMRYKNTDTIFISASNKIHINDSIKKYVINRNLSVKSVLIAQPSEIIDFIDFRNFSCLETLTLSGNDDDVLQNRRYNFMDSKSLKRINLYSVFVQYPSRNSDDSDNYTYKSKMKFRKFVHFYRPDIKVCWLNNFNDRIVWTE